MISATSKHAIRALVFLSEAEEEKYFSVDIIAENSAAPAAFLSKIVKRLSSAGLVETKKGAGGGVRIKKKDISFRDVCQALDDPIIVEQCLLSKTNCNLKSPCQYHEKWSVQRAQIANFLDQMII